MKEEMLRVLDESGSFVGRYEEKKRVHAQGLWHNEAALYIVDSAKNLIMLQRRSPNKASHPNRLGLTAGHVDGDESIEHALFREAREEIDLDLTKFMVKFLKVVKLSNPNNNHFSHRFILDSGDIVLKNLKLQKSEVTEVLWLDYDEWKERIINGDQEIISPGSPVINKETFDLIDAYMPNRKK